MSAAEGQRLSPEGQHLIGTLSSLYPPPLTVHSGGRHGQQERSEFLVLPSPRRPRIILPADRPRAAGRMTFRQLTGRRLRTRLSRLLVTAGLATGMADRFASGRRLCVHGPEAAPSIETVLQHALARPRVLIAMGAGPPPANRKPVLQVTDERGGVLAFVKVGHNALTHDLVQAERSALQHLATAGPVHVRVPRVLGFLTWRGLSLLVLEPLPIGSGMVTRMPRRAVIQVVSEVSGLHRTGHARQGWQSQRAELLTSLEECGPRGLALARHLHELDGVDPVIARGAWHGDLNPGNICRTRSETLVWDWERFGRSAPVGFDLLHHDLHRDITVLGVPARAAAQGLLDTAQEVLAPLGVSSAAAAVTARLYLLTLAARYLGDGQDQAGAHLGQVEEWLGPVLAGNVLPRREHCRDA